MEFIKEKVNNINNLSKGQLTELKEKLEIKDRNDWVETQKTGRRRVFCWIEEIEKRIKEKEKKQDRVKGGFLFNNLNFEAEKEIEAVAYNEPTFTPNETEADIEISTNDLTHEELCDIEDANWERLQEENRKELEELNWSIREENIEWGAIGTSSTNTFYSQRETKEQKEIRELKAENERLKRQIRELQKEQQAQILQLNKK